MLYTERNVALSRRLQSIMTFVEGSRATLQLSKRVERTNIHGKWSARRRILPPAKSKRMDTKVSKKKRNPMLCTERNVALSRRLQSIMTFVEGSRATLRRTVARKDF